MRNAKKGVYAEQYKVLGTLDETNQTKLFEKYI
jgi:hypothetical protein